MSGVFDLDDEGRRALDAEVRRQGAEPPAPPTPGFWSGSASAVGQGTLRGGAKLVRGAAQVLGTPLALGLDALHGGTRNQDALFRGIDDIAGNAVDYFTPDAATQGTGAQVLGGLSELILQLPFGAGGLATGFTSGTGTELVQRGVDGATAGKVAAVAGASVAVGLGIGPQLGRTALERVGGGALANVVINAPATAAEGAILKGAGYSEQAQGYDWRDPTARATDLLAGAAFGGAAHVWAVRQARAQAQATLDNAQHYQRDSAPGGPPLTPADQTAHVENMNAALNQVARGESVSMEGRPMPQTRGLAGVRGIRNNNPGNIEFSETNRWQGSTPGRDTRFASFDTPENGIRAMGITLRNYEKRHGLNTVEAIVGRWSPAKENGEANTAAYVRDVARTMGIDPRAKITLRDPATLESLLNAMIRHENGGNPYTQAQMQEGVKRAIKSSTIKTRPGEARPRVPIYPDATVASLEGSLRPDPETPPGRGERADAPPLPPEFVGRPPPATATTDAGTSVPVRATHDDGTPADSLPPPRPEPVTPTRQTQAADTPLPAEPPPLLADLASLAPGARDAAPGGGPTDATVPATPKRPWRDLHADEPIPLRGDEAGFVEGMPAGEIRRLVREHAKANVVGTYRNADTGLDIEVRPRGVKDATSHGGSADQFRALAAVPQVLERGAVTFHGPNPKNPNEDFMVVAHRVAIGAKDYLVSAGVRIEPNGKLFYVHELTDITPIDPRVAGAPDTPAEPVSDSGPGATGLNHYTARYVARQGIDAPDYVGRFGSAPAAESAVAQPSPTPEPRSAFAGTPDMMALTQAERPGEQPTRAQPTAAPEIPAEPPPDAAPVDSQNVAAAREALAATPDLLVPTDDERVVPASTLLAEADAHLAQTEKDAGAFDAAVRCMLGSGS